MKALLSASSIEPRRHRRKSCASSCARASGWLTEAWKESWKRSCWERCIHERQDRGASRGAQARGLSQSQFARIRHAVVAVRDHAVLRIRHRRHAAAPAQPHQSGAAEQLYRDRKSTRLNSSHVEISYAVFCLKKKKQTKDKGNACTHPYMTLGHHHN